jgi:tetratricopeptide (TPR) repeat protein
LEDNQREQLKKLISLFPEALNYCLNTDTTFYQNITDFHKKSKKKEQIGNLNLLLYRLLIQNLHTGILIQYFKNQNMVHSILQEKGLMDHAIYSNIVMLKGFEPYLDFQANYIVGFRKYVGKGPLKPGSFVTPTNKGQLVSELAKLIGLKDYEGVIEESDKFLAEPSLEEFKHQFLINKGVAYAFLGKFIKSIQIYEEALKFNKQLPILYANIFRAWFNKYKQAINNQEEYPIFPIYLLRYLNNAKEYLDKLNALELDEEELKKIKDLENAETDLKTKFSAFYDQSLNGMDPNDIPFFLVLVTIISEDYLEPLYKANTELIDSLIDIGQTRIKSDNWNYLANFYKILGIYDKALSAIDKGINRIDTKTDILALADTKGEILYNLGKFEESLECFNKVLDIDKDDIRVKNFYAETCWKAAKTFKKLGNIKRFEELRLLTKELIDTHCIDEKVKTKILYELNDA